MCFVAYGLMLSSASAFWPFGKSKNKEQDNRNYAGTAVNAKSENSKITTSTTITVIWPTMPETLIAGKNYTIEWKSKGFGKKEKASIYLSRTVENGQIVTPFAVNVPNNGSYVWRAPEILGDKFTILIKIGLESDYSDNYFSIERKNFPPTIIGATKIPADIKVGQQVDFNWIATDANNDNLAWRIDWGDNLWAEVACESAHLQNGMNYNIGTGHYWKESGTYKVVATVNDCRGKTDKKESTAVVKD